MNLSTRPLDLSQSPVVEDVCTDHTLKVVVYERQLPHLMIDKSDIRNRSSLQPAFKGLESRFRDVQSHNLKSLFAKKHGVTTCPATEVENFSRAFTFQVLREIHYGCDGWRSILPSSFSPDNLTRMCFV